MKSKRRRIGSLAILASFVAFGSLEAQAPATVASAEVAARLDRAVTPCFQAECFYHTRYHGWARELYQVGAEIGISRHFRVEPSVARQVDRPPEQVRLIPSEGPSCRG
jgi:hypothetical protein